MLPAVSSAATRMSVCLSVCLNIPEQLFLLIWHQAVWKSWITTRETHVRCWLWQQKSPPRCCRFLRLLHQHFHEHHCHRRWWGDCWHPAFRRRRCQTNGCWRDPWSPGPFVARADLAWPTCSDGRQCDQCSSSSVRGCCWQRVGSPPRSDHSEGGRRWRRACRLRSWSQSSLTRNRLRVRASAHGGAFWTDVAVVAAVAAVWSVALRGYWGRISCRSGGLEELPERSSFRGSVDGSLLSRDADGNRRPWPRMGRTLGESETFCRGLVRVSNRLIKTPHNMTDRQRRRICFYTIASFSSEGFYCTGLCWIVFLWKKARYPLWKAVSCELNCQWVMRSSSSASSPLRRPIAAARERGERARSTQLAISAAAQHSSSTELLLLLLLLLLFMAIATTSQSAAR